MLARGRFKTETPNVIDPGDETPFRPARVEPVPNDEESHEGSVSIGSGSTIRHYNGFKDPNSTVFDGGITSSRHQQTNKGTISRGVRIDYILDADDEPGFHDGTSDDETNGLTTRGVAPPAVVPPRVSQYTNGHGPTPPAVSRHSSSSISQHSIEQSRLFAAAMLNKSDRHLLDAQQQQQQKQEESVLQRMIRGKRNYNYSTNDTNVRDAIYIVEDTGGVNSNDPNRSRRRRMCRILFLLVAVAVIVTFSVIAVQSVHNRGDGQSDLLVDDDLSPRLQSTIKYLSDRGISLSTNLYDPTSPQHRAAHWIANVDSEQLVVPDTEVVDATGIRFVQRYILAVLYYSWKGDELWAQSLDFISGTHECGWFQTMTDALGNEFAMGIGCDIRELQVRSIMLRKFLCVRLWSVLCHSSAFLHLTNIDQCITTLTNLSIASNNVTGSIPDEIQHLTKLDLLSLEHNSLTGSIPASLDKLTLLEFLDLNFNALTGSIPTWLGPSLGSLKVLGLSHNNLHGSIPASLLQGDLGINLKTLALDNNMLSGDALPIQRLKNLEFLYLSDNDLSGQLEFGLLADMPFLHEVDLSHNRFSGLIPDHLFLTPKLRVLDLGNNEFSGRLPTGTASHQSVILQPSAIEFLSVRNNSISSTIPESLLGHMPSLTHLDLSMNALEGVYPTTLVGLNNLTYLFLGNNNFEAGPVPKVLQSLTNLRELSLDNLQLEGTIPSWLQGFKQLKLLDLSNNELNGSISLDFEELKNMIFLMLHDNLLTGPLPASIESLKNLIVLSIHHNNVTGDITTFACTEDTGLELVTIDCGVTVCPCCTPCCDSDDCFKDYVWDALKHNDGKWEEQFQRSDYSFNPMITISGNH